MSRISELEFYNDKDVITQIEWLKNNIKADHIDHIQVEQNGDKTSEDYGLTTVKITMENGHEYEGKVTSAILKDVRIQSGEDFNVMIFELANGETISCNIPLGSDSYWAKIKGEPQSNTALKAWMDEKAEAVDLTNETRLRVSSDEALGQRITDLDRDVSEEIGRIDGELANKADKSALDEEITKRTEADTGLLQAITDEENARKSADEILETAITGKADQSALETEIAARTDSDTGLLQAITAEETARKSADDGIYGMIVKVNKDLDDETTARTEADALKEDKANKVAEWSATPSDDRYPSEKLVYEKCFKVDYQLTETDEYIFAEHKLANKITMLEGQFKSFTINPTSGKNFDLTFKNNYNFKAFSITPQDFSGYSNVSVAVENTPGNTARFTFYNTGNTTITATFVFIGIGFVV